MAARSSVPESAWAPGSSPWLWGGVQTNTVGGTAEAGRSLGKDAPRVHDLRPGQSGTETLAGLHVARRLSPNKKVAACGRLRRPPTQPARLHEGPGSG